MSLGLKRGMVALEPHSAEWDTAAGEMIALLREIFGEAALDIQHVGSTAIPSIPAKPIVDIAVGVEGGNTFSDWDRVLLQYGLICRGEDVPGQRLYVAGYGDVRTHHIHVVEYQGTDWNNYVNLRDYLNAVPDAAETYAAIKRRLALQFPEKRGHYTRGKQEVLQDLLVQAQRWRTTGQSS